MSLHHAYAIIEVDDESGEIVTLAMHETVAVCRRVACKSACHPHLICTGKHGLPEIRTKRRIVEAQYADSNRADLIMSICKNVSVRSMHRHKIAL